MQLLRKELLEAKQRLVQLEPAWEMFIEKYNDEEEAQDLEQRRRAAVVSQLSERRSRRQGNESSRIELRGVTIIGCCGQLPVACNTSRQGLNCRHLTSPGRHQPSECFRQQRLRVPKVLENPVPLRPRATPTRRVLQRSTAALRSGMCRRHYRIARVLLRCSPYVEKNSSRTLCGRPPLLISRRRR